MDIDDLIHPNRPFGDEIESLTSIYDGQDEDFVRTYFPKQLAELYREYALFNHPGSSEPERITAFLNHIASLSQGTPAPEVLEQAPFLDEWCAIHDIDTVILIGIVTGHPHLRHQARARTSLLFQIHPEQGWARTWSRYYRLGTHSRLTFFEWQYEGKISPLMRIVEFDG